MTAYLEDRLIQYFDTGVVSKRRLGSFLLFFLVLLLLFMRDIRDQEYCGRNDSLEKQKSFSRKETRRDRVRSTQKKKCHQGHLLPFAIVV